MSPVSVTLNEISIENGTEAAVKHGSTEPLTLVVNRIFGDRPAKPSATATAVELSLKAQAFYRGRTFDGNPWQLTLNPIKSDFLITVESDRAAIKKQFNRDLPRDQFELHPDKGYVYPGWTHLCRFDLLYVTDTAGATPVNVEVEWGLKNEGTPNVQSLTLPPNEKTKIVGEFEIRFERRTREQAQDECCDLERKGVRRESVAQAEETQGRAHRSQGLHVL